MKKVFKVPLLDGVQEDPNKPASSISGIEGPLGPQSDVLATGTWWPDPNCSVFTASLSPINRIFPFDRAWMCSHSPHSLTPCSPIPHPHAHPPTHSLTHTHPCTHPHPHTHAHTYPHSLTYAYIIMYPHLYTLTPIPPMLSHTQSHRLIHTFTPHPHANSFKHTRHTHPYTHYPHTLTPHSYTLAHHHAHTHPPHSHIYTPIPSQPPTLTCIHTRHPKLRQSGFPIL